MNPSIPTSLSRASYSLFALNPQFPDIPECEGVLTITVAACLLPPHKGAIIRSGAVAG